MSDNPILAALARLEAGQAAIRTDFLDELGKTRGAIMTKVEGLQDSLTGIREDIGVNMGAADSAQRVNDNTREDMRALREQVSSMWRQLKVLEAKVREITGDS